MSLHKYPALYVGGPVDGRRDFIAGHIKDGRHPMRFATQSMQAAFNPFEPPRDFAHYQQATTTEYFPVDQIGDVLLLAPRGMNRTEVMRRLMAGYQGERG